MSTMQQIRQSWEYRSIKFLLRIMAYALLIAYLFGTSSSVLLWAKMKWIRAQPLEEITAVADESIANRQPEKLMDWVTLRQKKDRPYIIKNLEPYTGKISSYTFIQYAHWAMAEGKKEEAVFWRQYALYRLRYDALRCGAVDGTKDVQGLTQLYPDRAVQAALDADPLLGKKSIIWVLDKDAHYPAENYPIDVCDFVNKINDRPSGLLVPRDKWPGLRHSLRLVTEDRLQKMQD